MKRFVLTPRLPSGRRTQRGRASAESRLGTNWRMRKPSGRCVSNNSGEPTFSAPTNSPGAQSLFPVFRGQAKGDKIALPGKHVRTRRIRRQRDFQNRRRRGIRLQNSKSTTSGAFWSQPWGRPDKMSFHKRSAPGPSGDYRPLAEYPLSTAQAQIALESHRQPANAPPTVRTID